MSNDKRFHIAVGLSNEQVKEIKKIAIDEGRSVAKMVKEFILGKINKEK